MCSLILRIDETGVFIGANRDELVTRAWQPPAEFWPGIIAGRDEAAGGTWLGLNRHGVMAAVLNRHGSLGPAPGKRSRGDLPLLALQAKTAAQAAAAIAALDAGAYRSFNLVTADSTGAFFLKGLETGLPEQQPLATGVWMITSGEPNEAGLPRIARHLPKFQAAAWTDWAALLADNSGPWTSAIDIPEQDGFATICSSLIALPKTGAPQWLFAAGPPDQVDFQKICSF